MSDDTSSHDLNDAAYQRALAILIDVGTSIAQELKIPSAQSTVVARSAAFDRVALAVRRTITLSRHIAEHPINPGTPESRRLKARKHVIRVVDDTIDHRADPAEAKDLRVELLERLDSPEFELDLTNRSPAELIKELCRDLGLANIRGVATYRRRTPDDIAILCAQAAAPAGSGLPQWLAATADQAQQNDLNPEAPPDPDNPDILKKRRHH